MMSLKLKFEIRISSAGPSALFLGSFEVDSSLLSIWVFLLMVFPFNFRKSRAIFTILSFFTVITAGLTKQFSSLFRVFLI